MSIPANPVRAAGPSQYATAARGRRDTSSSGFSRELSDAVSTLGRGGSRTETTASAASVARSRAAEPAATAPASSTTAPATPAPSTPATTTPAASAPTPAASAPAPAAPRTTTATAEPGRVAGNPFASSSPPLTPAQAARAAEPKVTAWCPWEGPCDPRDAIPFGGGELTTSGAPKIVENAAPTRNQYSYAGPAAKNPYFTTPGNPLREGYVAGFGGWFLNNPAILGPNQKSTAANPTYFATEEGAKEALRLVQQYEPGAQLTSRSWGGGPFISNQSMYFITLPNGKELNAGGVIDGYYNRGFGVTISSDAELERSIRLA